MRKLVIVAVAAALLLHVDARDCQLTGEDFMRQLSMMKDWPTIYAIFKQNLPACPDDGFFAEGYDEVVVTVLAKRWSNLPELNKLTARDSKFRAFVYRHISATTNPTDLQRVLANAETNSPAGFSKICSDIAINAKRAIAGHQ